MRPATIGDVQWTLRAISSATFCHSVGLQPCAAVASVVSWRRWTKAGSRSRPRLWARAASGSQKTSQRSAPAPRIRRVMAAVLGHADDRADVAVTQRGVDAVDDGDEGGTLGPGGQHDDGEIEHRRPVVERPGDPGQAGQRQLRVGVLRHWASTLARTRTRTRGIPGNVPVTGDVWLARALTLLVSASEQPGGVRDGRHGFVREQRRHGRGLPRRPEFGLRARRARAPGVVGSRAPDQACVRPARGRGLHRARARPLPRCSSRSTRRWTRPRN